MCGLSVTQVARVRLPVHRVAFESRSARFVTRVCAILLAMIVAPLVVEAQSAGEANSPRDPGAGSSSPITSSSLNAASSSSPQEYPEEKPKTKQETTVGAIKLRFYGTVLFNMSFSDSDEVGQEVPLWPIPGSVPIGFPDGSTVPSGHIHDTVFSARQSIFGF